MSLLNRIALELCVFAPRVGCFDCDVASFCNTWCCFCVSRLLQLPLRRHKKPFSHTRVCSFSEIVCTEIAQVAVCSTTTTCSFSFKAQLCNKRVVCLPAVFSHTHWRFCATQVVFCRKSEAFVVCGGWSQQLLFCQVSLFAIPLQGQRCFSTHGLAILLLNLQKKSAMPNLALRLVVGFCFVS